MSDTLKEIEELIENEKKYTEILIDLEKKIKKMEDEKKEEDDDPFDFIYSKSIYYPFK